jgi:hypothetical protein
MLRHGTVDEVAVRSNKNTAGLSVVITFLFWVIDDWVNLLKSASGPSKATLHVKHVLRHSKLIRFEEQTWFKKISNKELPVSTPVMLQSQNKTCLRTHSG